MTLAELPVVSIVTLYEVSQVPKASSPRAFFSPSRPSRFYKPEHRTQQIRDDWVAAGKSAAHLRKQRLQSLICRQVMPVLLRIMRFVLGLRLQDARLWRW